MPRPFLVHRPSNALTAYAGVPPLASPRLRDLTFAITITRAGGLGSPARIAQRDGCAVSPCRLGKEDARYPPLMATISTEWNVLRHGPLETLADNLWRVTGALPG